jgi:hypothetical protein
MRSNKISPVLNIKFILQSRKEENLDPKSFERCSRPLGSVEILVIELLQVMRTPFHARFQVGQIQQVEITLRSSSPDIETSSCGDRSSPGAKYLIDVVCPT